MIFFDYQFHLMILMQPSVGYLFKKKKNSFQEAICPSFWSTSYYTASTFNSMC